MTVTSPRKGAAVALDHLVIGLRPDQYIPIGEEKILIAHKILGKLGRLPGPVQPCLADVLNRDSHRGSVAEIVFDDSARQPVIMQNQ
jgi:hypothetical protein